MFEDIMVVFVELGLKIKEERVKMFVKGNLDT